MRRWYGGSTFGRLRIDVDLSAINRPRFHFAAEQRDPADWHYDWGYVGISYGTGNSDPVVGAEIDLGGTRVGHWIFLAYWKVGDWIDARRKTPASRE